MLTLKSLTKKERKDLRVIRLRMSHLDRVSVTISHFPRNTYLPTANWNDSSPIPACVFRKPQIYILSAAESTAFYYLVAACAYRTLEYVKSLPNAFQNTKDPLPKMLVIATLRNRPEIAEHCIWPGSPSRFSRPISSIPSHPVGSFLWNLQGGSLTMVSDINYGTEYFGDFKYRL